MADEALEPKSLDEALLILQADPPVLVKNMRGQVGNQKTKYADLVQVNSVVLSRLNALGCIYKTKPMLRVEDPKFVLWYSLKHVASGTEDSGEYPLKLSENPMQMGSAITYARRYVLLAITGIAAEDEDDDAQAYGGRSAQRATRQTPPSAGRGVPTPTAQRSSTASAPPALPGEAGGGITQAQSKMLHGLLRKADLGERADALAYIAEVLGKAGLASTKDLTTAEATAVIDRLVRYVDQLEPPDSAALPKAALPGAVKPGEGA